MNASKTDDDGGHQALKQLQKMNMYKNQSISLLEKIEYVEGRRLKNMDKRFGIVPEDFHILSTT